MKRTLQISTVVAGTIGAAAVVLSTGPITIPLVLKAIAAAASALTVGGSAWTANPPAASQSDATKLP
jgi:hypothetical protein